MESPPKPWAHVGSASTLYEHGVGLFDDDEVAREQASGRADDSRTETPIPALIGGKYAVESLIGRGSMGSVYRCVHLGLEMPVALKILHPNMIHNAQFVQRFKREALAASRLDHLNSVRVIDYGEDASGLLYLVMDYVEGRDLFRVLQEEWPFADEQVVDIMAQVLAPLAVAHQLGIVHRDLKPENIMVLRRAGEDGRALGAVKVCDFGVAHLLPALETDPGTRAPSLTLNGLLIGTPAYMSPEQARGEPIDARTDIYAAGVLLFQLLTGELPFVADSPVAIAAMQYTVPTPRPSQRRPVHPVLECICEKALSKRPHDRYQTAREMRDALLSALQPTPAVSTLVTSRSRVRPVSRHMLGAFTIATLSLAAAGFYRLPTSPPHGEETRAGQLVHSGVAVASSWHSATPVRATAAAALPYVSEADECTPEASAALTSGWRISPLGEAAGPRAAAAPNSAPAAVRARTGVGHGPRPQPGVPRVAPSSRVEAADDMPASALALRVAASATRVAPSQVDAAQPSPTSTSPPQAGPTRRAIASGQAHISIKSIAAHGVPQANIRRALRHPGLTACYQDSLRALAGDLNFTAELAIATDLRGRVITAVLRGAALPNGLGRCFEQRIRSRTVTGVDTGAARATVQLSFHPR